MSRNPMPPRLSGALYACAGLLFVIGAFASGQPGFSVVGLAFVGLGLAMWVRHRNG